MKKIIAISSAVLLMLSCKMDAQVPTQTKPKKMETTIYDFKINDIEGNAFDLSSLKGKKVLIVNTASKCGLTPQYEQLEKIYNEYKASGFTIIGFPANNFASQEPGSNKEIAEFCQRNYGVSFPMMEKISVKGSDIHPLYEYLTSKSKNGLQDAEVEWNFQKFLIDENGKLVKVVPPKTLPTDAEIVGWIKS